MAQEYGYLQFNPPNVEERGIIDKFNTKANKMPTDLERFFNPDNIVLGFFRQGNFVICLLRFTHQYHTFIGVAKRNPKADEEDEQRARNIALYRAMRNQVIYDPVNVL